jgi:ubiquitin C-terminal hydrolase
MESLCKAICNHDAVGVPLPIHNALKELIESPGVKSAIALRDHVAKISKNNYDDNGQHDAHDFARDLLRGLNEEYRQGGTAQTIVEQSLGFILQNTCTCPCQNISTTLEPETIGGLDLELLLKNGQKVRDLTNCLTNFFGPEEIPDYRCEKCNKKQDATKTTKMIESPPYLLIRLKRFRMVENNKKEKVPHQVVVPENLNIDGEIYKLKSYLNHEGKIGEGGHYFALVNEGQHAIKYNDLNVTTLNSEEALKHRTTSYVIVYEKSIVSRQPEVKVASASGDRQEIKVECKNCMFKSIHVAAAFIPNHHECRKLDELGVPIVKCVPCKLIFKHAIFALHLYFLAITRRRSYFDFRLSANNTLFINNYI